MKLVKYIFAILVSLILSINFAIAEKWDMALAYGAGNFHSANATEFAKLLYPPNGERTIHPRNILSVSYTYAY